MKKLALLVLPMLLLSGCANNKTNNKSNSSEPVLQDLKILCPTGAPAFAFYKHGKNSNFETNTDPKNIVAMMNKNSEKQLIVIDTVSGVKAIQNGAPYKLAATLTFGNFFIASTGKDDNNTMDPGDKIVLFGQGITPDLLFHHLYGDTYDSGIEYVTNVQDAAKCLIQGKNLVTGNEIKYVFIAQPVLLNALAKNANAAKYVDVQEAYKAKSGGKELIQASVFVKNDADDYSVNHYLDALKNDIDAAIDNPEIISETLSYLSAEEATAKYGVAPAMAVNALKDNNGLGLGFKKSLEIKSDIDAFLKDVQNLEATSEEIYYK